MSDFLVKHSRQSRAMKKAWAQRKAQRKPIYNLTITITDHTNSPGIDLAVALEMADIGPELAGEALVKIKQAALAGQMKLDRNTADLLGLSVANHKGHKRESFQRVTESPLSTMSDDI